MAWDRASRRSVLRCAAMCRDVIGSVHVTPLGTRLALCCRVHRGGRGTGVGPQLGPSAASADAPAGVAPQLGPLAASADTPAGDAPGSRSRVRHSPRASPPASPPTSPPTSPLTSPPMSPLTWPCLAPPAHSRRTTTRAPYRTRRAHTQDRPPRLRLLRSRVSSAARPLRSTTPRGSHTPCRCTQTQARCGLKPQRRFSRTR